MVVNIAPSILSANFAYLANEIKRVEHEADLLHIDVMDNRFVPNLTLGLKAIKDIKTIARTPLDCHLMIEDCDRWGPIFAAEGADGVTVHVESTAFPVRTLRAIRAAGARAGLALSPATAVEPYLEMLSEMDVLHILTTEPGFGGQPLLDFVLPKLKRACLAVSDSGLPVRVEVDGGITKDTIMMCAREGAQIFVSGAVFHAEDSAMAIAELRRLAMQAASQE